MTRKEKDKERYNYYKSHGICPNCGSEKARRGFVYCANCAEVQAVCQMVRRAKIRKEKENE